MNFKRLGLLVSLALLSWLCLFGYTNIVAMSQGGTGATTASAARTNLGLGSIATQASDNVSITGGSVTGITDLAVADGGTGASTAAGARTNLGAIGGGLGSTDNAVLRADGTGGATAQGSSVTIADGGAIQTASELLQTTGSARSHVLPPTVSTWTTGTPFTIATLSDGDGSYFIYCFYDVTRTAGGTAVQNGGQIRVRVLSTAGTLAVRQSAVSSYLGGFGPTYGVDVSGTSLRLTVTSAGSSGEFMTSCTVSYAGVDLES